MPVSLSRLRIAGFKSFPEPAMVEIRPGLTGIVGPNGCGKSNVVEALRWAMGESSARSLRGGDMEDVIFAGTAHRPSRNIAEVTIALDHTQGFAPPPFHEAPELEITRRIERGTGSFFRINGREARARDVQTLFADLATGARASAMVSQGRVGALVGARPEERRTILEEAAGITGLHARRHEAELKLRAAEANLERAEDLRGQLTAQLETLRRQAKQAARFRTIHDAVRAAEAELLAVQRALAEKARDLSRQTFSAAADCAATAAAEATGVSARATEAAAALPALRSAEADARTALERAKLAAEQASVDAERSAQALRAAEHFLRQTERDRAHAAEAGSAAAAALQRLTEEQQRLAVEAEKAPEALASAKTAAETAAAALLATESLAQAAGERAASLAAAARAAAETLATAERRAQRVTEQAARVQAEQAQAESADASAEALATAEEDARQAEQRAAASHADHEAAEIAAAAARENFVHARETAAQAEAARTKLAAAAQGLAETLAVRDGGPDVRMVDRLTVPAGLEAALGAAFSEELEAPSDAAAPRHWRALPTSPEPAHLPAHLPAAAEALAGMVQAPEALAKALSQVGVVADTNTGEALQPALAPGQILVTRDGDAWRWDGFCVRADAPKPAAVRLQQRNRLACLRQELLRAEAEAEAAAGRRAEAEAAERAAVATEQKAREAVRVAAEILRQARARAGQLREQAAAAAARRAALAESWAHLQAELSDAQAALESARDAQRGLGDPETARTAAEQARAAFSAARAEEQAARGAWEALRRAAAARTQRLDVLQRELGEAAAQAAASRDRVAELEDRLAQARQDVARLASEPATMAARQGEALDAVQASETAHRHAADALHAAESAAREADRSARAAEAALASAREQRIRAEADLSTADAGCAAVAERIAERLGETAVLPNPPATVDTDAEERAKKRVERLQREREGMGPVNFRAEVEAAEVAAQAETIEREAAELSTAIAKLRGSIGHINREGRERLNQTLADIDRHFRSLFETMFGGGKAHLALVGSDDPLLAGLEIYAQPPGKKLATLSLLSGGEQALTALSLIFAVFRCNPAPVCVLDEVDAPLDDINVDRFCGMLDALVRETGTRFLVVTHHQLTMARMDRLYGVTMQERGVSRLLSVDLARAAEMVEQMPMAAE